MSNFITIPEYPQYQVSDCGEVLSLNSRKLLIPQVSSTGYLYVNLYKEGKMKSVKIHRLVAKLFVPNPENLPQVNHKDENKLNNKADNLEWCTLKYNHDYGTGVLRSHEKQKLPIKGISKQSSEVLTFDSLTSAAEYLYNNGIGTNVKGIICSLSDCLNHKLKSYRGYVWERINRESITN